MILLLWVWPFGRYEILASSFAGGVFIYAGTRPRRQRFAAILTIGGVCAALYCLRGGLANGAFATAMAVAGFLGMGGVFLLALELIWEKREGSGAALRDACLLPAFVMVSMVSMQLANENAHPNYDYFLDAFDATLGGSFVPRVVSLFRAAPPLQNTCWVVYHVLLILPPLFHGWACYKRRARVINLVHAFAIGGMCAFVLYQICPAQGPRYVFGSDFAARMIGAGSAPLRVLFSAGWSNAMPSMHMTWALLLWWYAREIGKLAGRTAGLFGVLTALATLGLGEHYFIDLVVAAPMLMAVAGLCGARHGWTATGFAMVIAWAAALRTGILVHAPAGLNWGFVVATVLATAVVMRQRPPLRACDTQPFGSIAEVQYAAQLERAGE